MKTPLPYRPAFAPIIQTHFTGKIDGRDVKFIIEHDHKLDMNEVKERINWARQLEDRLNNRPKGEPRIIQSAA